MGNERRVAVSTPKAPSPRFSYSQGIIAQGLLFIAGQVPIDPETGSVAETFADQVHQTLKNLAAVAEAAGGSLADAVRVSVYLEDLDRVQEMDAIYRGYFAVPLPARTTIRAGLRGFMVEMDAVVALEGQGPEPPSGSPEQVDRLAAPGTSSALDKWEL